MSFARSPNINRNITADRLSLAQSTAATAKFLSSSSSVSALEHDLITAMAARMGKNRTVSNGWSYDVAYAEDLDRLAIVYPDVKEVLCFAVEAHMATTPWTYYDVPTREPLDWVPAAIGNIQRVLDLDPNFLYALHLHIHIVEPVQFEPSVDAIEVSADTLYNLIGTTDAGMGHLKHMPGHALFQISRWHDASEANLVALNMDRAYFASCPLTKNEAGTGYNQFYF